MCITNMLRVSTTNTKTKTKSKPKRKIKLKTIKRTTKRITSTELLLLMLTTTMSIVTMTVGPATAATAAKTIITTTTTEGEVTRTSATMTTNVILTSTTTEMRGLSSTQQQQQQRREAQFQQQQLQHMQSLALVGGDPADVTAFATQTQFRSPVSDDGTFVSPSRSSRSSNNNNNMGYYVKDDYHSNAFLPSAASSSTPLSPLPSSASASSTLSSSPSPQTPPVFDFGLPRNITARSGQTAAINCRVENLGDKSVSWIRKRDLHILTAGILTYTSDERFRVIRTDDSENWSLHVKFAQPRDSGIYECQVNTEPKISMAFRLNVVVTSPDSTAIIAGPTDLYAKVGSSITLNCRVKQPSSQEIGPIHWYRGPYIITPFVVHPNDAAVDLSRRISMESQLGDILKSRLRIANAQTTDSGNYTCMPTTAEAASVMVHVINDEHPAAMQKSAATTTTNLLPPIIIIIGHFMETVQLLDNLLTFLRTS